MMAALAKRTSSATHGTPARDVFENAAAPTRQVQALGIEVGLEEPEGQGIPDQDGFRILEHLEGHEARHSPQIDTLDRKIGERIEASRQISQDGRWPRTTSEEGEVKVAVDPLAGSTVASESHDGLKALQFPGIGRQAIEQYRWERTSGCRIRSHGSSLAEGPGTTKDGMTAGR